MKKMLLAVLLAVGLFAVSAPVMAADGVDVYSLTLTTYSVVGAVDVSGAEAAMPFNSGGTKRISRIELVITSTNTSQTVDFYDTATSSDVITAKWSYTSTPDAANAVASVVTKTYDFISPTSGSNLTYYKVTDFYAKKSNVNSAVILNYWYLK